MTHLELLPSTFAIATSDNGCVDIEEAVLLEEKMRGERKSVPDASYSPNRVGAGSEVSLLSQKLKGGLLLGDRVHCGVAVSNMD